MGNTMGVTEEQNFAHGIGKASSPKFTSNLNLNDTYEFDTS